MYLEHLQKYFIATSEHFRESKIWDDRWHIQLTCYVTKRYQVTTKVQKQASMLHCRNIFHHIENIRNCSDHF